MIKRIEAFNEATQKVNELIDNMNAQKVIILRDAVRLEKLELQYRILEGTQRGKAPIIEEETEEFVTALAIKLYDVYRKATSYEHFVDVKEEFSRLIQLSPEGFRAQAKWVISNFASLRDKEELTKTETKG